MLKRLWTALALMALAVAAPFVAASAQIVVNVGDGTYKPYPIAVPEFTSDGPEAEEFAAHITEVLRNDLTLTGLFDLTDPAAFIQRDLDINAEPRFADWRVIGVDGLVVGHVETLEDGRLAVSARLWNILGNELYRLDGRPGYAGVTAPINWRVTAHQIADRIYTRLTGEDGYLNTRVVFIAESGPRTNRVKKLAIMDADGPIIRSSPQGCIRC